VCLCGAADELVDREQELLDLCLLVVDVLRDQLQVAEPLARVRVAGLLGGLHLLGQPLDGLRHVLELALQLLELVIDRRRIHELSMAPQDGNWLRGSYARAGVFRRDDRHGRRCRPALVELVQRQGHQHVAGDLRALADELPRLGRRPLGGQLADRVVHMHEESVLLHRRAPIRLLVFTR